MRIHSKENCYMCHKCKKVFQNGTKLYQHVQTHGKVRLTCSYCNKVFRFSKLLNRHVLAVHKKIAGLRCNAEQCGLAFRKLTDVKEHVRAAHSVVHPVVGNHWVDEYNGLYTIKEFDPEEMDLAPIYEGLDTELDTDILGRGETTRRDRL